MGGHEYREPAQILAELSRGIRVSPDPSAALHGPHGGRTGPVWSAEWSAGRVDWSPLSPWFGQNTTTRVGFALVMFPDR